MPKIIWDFNEDKTLIKHLIDTCKKAKVDCEKKQGRSQPADYLIQTDGGATLLIERKTLIDGWNSLCKKEVINNLKTPKLYRQLGELLKWAAAIGPNAHCYLLLELECFIPRLKIPEHIIKKAVLSATSTSSKFVRVLVSLNRQHTAELLVKLAKEYDKREILG